MNKKKILYIILVSVIVLLAVFIFKTKVTCDKKTTKETVIMIDVNKKLVNAGYATRGSQKDVWYLTENMGNALPQEYKLEVKTHNMLTGKMEVEHVYKFVEQKK